MPAEGRPAGAAGCRDTAHATPRPVMAHVPAGASAAPRAALPALPRRRITGTVVPAQVGHLAHSLYYLPMASRELSPHSRSLFLHIHA